MAPTVEGIPELAHVEALRVLVKAGIKEYECETGYALSKDVQSDMRLARFINAYDGDLAAAADAYKAMLNWRKSEEVEALRKTHMSKEFCGLEQKSLPHWELVQGVGDYGPWMHAGECFHGDLVHLECIGLHDPTMLIETVTPERILEYQIGFLEIRAKVLDDLSAENNRLVRTVQVRDLSRFGIHLLQHTKATTLIRTVMKAGSAYYPESTRKSIFLNTPISFYAFWKAVSVVLRKKTLDKVVFLKNDYHRELLKYVDARSIHRMEKMNADTDHSFIERGSTADMLPLSYDEEVVVPAGGTAYYPIWMTRSQARASVEITLSPAKGSATPTIPIFMLSFLSNRVLDKAQTGQDGVVDETKLLAQAYATADKNRWVVTFPEQFDVGVDSGYLLVTFDNSASWVYSITVPIQSRFVNDNETSGKQVEAVPPAVP